MHGILCAVFCVCIEIWSYYTTVLEHCFFMYTKYYVKNLLCFFLRVFELVIFVSVVYLTLLHILHVEFRLKMGANEAYQPSLYYSCLEECFGNAVES